MTEHVCVSMCVLFQVSGSGLNLQSVVSVVQQTIKQLNRSKEEVNELRNQQKIQIQQQEEDMNYCRKYKERLHKVLTTLCHRVWKSEHVTSNYSYQVIVVRERYNLPLNVVN